jgi:hypothetical protein
MIERVEELAAKLQPPVFGEQEVLEDAQVDVLQARSVKRARRAVAKGAGRRNSKRRRVEEEARGPPPAKSEGSEVAPA